VSANQLRPKLFLIRRRVRHVEDLILRTDELFGMAVAVEAPLHGQRRSLIRERHFVDAAVASGAPDSLRHVNAVIEMDEVRQPMTQKIKAMMNTAPKIVTRESVFVLR